MLKNAQVSTVGEFLIAGVMKVFKGELGEEQIIGLYESSWTQLNICHKQGSPRAPHKEKSKIAISE